MPRTIRRFRLRNALPHRAPSGSREPSGNVVALTATVSDSSPMSIRSIAQYPPARLKRTSRIWSSAIRALATPACTSGLLVSFQLSRR